MPRRTAEERFAEKVDKTDSCWLWMAGCDQKGYGAFYDGRPISAHRWSYQYHVGPIPDGLQLDHLCRVRNCVNPDHLEPVTSRENSLRGQTLQAANVAKTHCPQGHPYSEANTSVRPNGGGYLSRSCRACVALHSRNYRARRAGKTLARQ